MAFAGAQKNLGPAGVTLVFVRRDLQEQAMGICPSAFHYKTVAANQSMFNTPPTYGIYMIGLVFEWLQAQGGIASIEARNIEKAELLYRTIDTSNFYSNAVAPAFRSRMNVPFLLADETLNDTFLNEAKAANLLSLKATNQSVACAPAYTTPYHWRVSRPWSTLCATLSARIK